MFDSIQFVIETKNRFREHLKRGTRALPVLVTVVVAAALGGCSAERVDRSSEDVGSTAQALSSSTPFFSPVSIPDGFLFAPNYDNGGEGVAYHDSDAVDHGTSTGSTFRTSEGVDVEGTPDFPAGGDHVGWTAPGEWQNYTVNVKAAGIYTVTASVAAPSAGARFHLAVNGSTVGSATVPQTGAWTTFQDVKMTNVRLNAGVQVLQVVEDTGGFNWRSFAFATSAPFAGSAALVPGTVLAQNYDDGGEGLAYHDADSADQGVATGCTFRASEGVDIEGTSANPSAANHVGWTAAGEWLDYTVDVLKTGQYTVTAAVAAPAAGASFRLFSGANLLGTFSVPSTGSWTQFQNVTLPNVTLTAGIQTLQVVEDSGGFNLASLVIAPKPNLLANGNFTQGLGNWITYVDSHTSAGTNITATGSQASATIVSGSNYQEWYVQLYQNGLTLLQGQNYSLSFDVNGCSGATGGRLNVVVEHDGAPYTPYLTSKTVSLPSCQASQHVSFNFLMAAPTDSQSRVTFNLGLDNLAPSNTLNLSHVVLSQSDFGNPNIVGHVATTDKLPLPGITVNLSGNQSATTTTDANGNYRFQVAPGNYAVAVSVPAGSSFAASSLALPNLAGDTIADFTCTGACGAAANIVAGKELVITDPSVTGDARASSSSAVAGAWSFRALIEQMAPVGTDPADFVEAWLNTFGTLQTVNGFNVSPRNLQALRDLWPTTANGKVDLSRPPFQLLAIVNRLDVGSQGNGEVRFVFGATGGANLPGLGMTVIFEYGLPNTDASTGAPLNRGAWAAKFHALGSVAFGAPFNSALQGLTDLVTKRNTSPNKPGGSSIDQVRSSENLMDPEFWQWRQFQLASLGSSVGLVLGMTGQTPTDAAGFGATPESQVMVSHLNTNPVLIHGGYIDVPSGVIGGASSISRFSWNFPGAAVVENARHNFAGMTCNGCHNLEAQGLQIDNFYLISPLTAGGPDGTNRLAPFIKQFEIPRRQRFLQNRLNCSGTACSAGGEVMFIQ